jgi:hypothetical protein
MSCVRSHFHSSIWPPDRLTETKPSVPAYSTGSGFLELPSAPQGEVMKAGTGRNDIRPTWSSITRRFAGGNRVQGPGASKPCRPMARTISSLNCHPHGQETRRCIHLAKPVHGNPLSRRLPSFCIFLSQASTCAGFMKAKGGGTNSRLLNLCRDSARTLLHVQKFARAPFGRHSE